MKIDREFAERILDEALRLGASSAEVYVQTKKGVNAEARDGSLESVKTALDFGYSVRVLNGGRMGFSFSTSKEDAMRTAAAAVEASRYTEEDEYLVLPGPSGAAQAGTAPASPEIYDPGVEKTGPAEALSHAIAVEKAAREADKRITKVRSATASFSTYEVFIANTNGVSGGYASTIASGQIMAVAEENGESQMGWDIIMGSFLSDIAFPRVGANAAGKALMLLGAQKTSPFKGHIVLDNSVAADFLGIFSSMLSAEAVQKGKSLLRDRVGQEVISPGLDVIDDGLLPRGIGTRPFDDEGVPVSKRKLVGRGVLADYMYNAYTARKAGRASTGNGIRGSAGAVPGTAPLNLYLASPDGKYSRFQDLVGAVSKGLYIVETMGMHTANPISGEFSVGVSGLMIESGATTYPVKEAVISGNILDLFKKAEALGDDLRFFGPVGSPSILLGPVDISA